MMQNIFCQYIKSKSHITAKSICSSELFDVESLMSAFSSLLDMTANGKPVYTPISDSKATLLKGLVQRWSTRQVMVWWRQWQVCRWLRAPPLLTHPESDFWLPPPLLAHQGVGGWQKKIKETLYREKWNWRQTPLKPSFNYQDVQIEQKKRGD